MNAVYLIKGSLPHEGQSFFGGYSITNDEIRISARTLLDFFAGRISHQQFLAAYHFVPGGDGHSNTWNPFDRKRKEGRLITEITIEKRSTEHDDDWLVIRFGAPDPAISPYSAPGSDTTRSQSARERRRRDRGNGKQTVPGSTVQSRG